MKRLVFTLVLVLSSQLVGAQQTTTYDTVVRSMACKQNLTGDLECDYHVGRSLHFGIAGVGRQDASIYFYASSFEGDFFAVFGVSHGCVVVRPGRSATPERITDLAFVSPRNGQVYRNWQECSGSK